MKLIQWSYNNLIVPMMEDDQKCLVTSGPILCAALGIAPKTLDKIAARHAHRFSWYMETNCLNISELLSQNRELFGIKRLRKDVKLWSDADMINVAFLSNSPMATHFQESVIELIRQQARKDYLSPEAFEKIVLQMSEQSAQLMELRADLESLRRVFDLARPSLNNAASAAGIALQAQRGIKKLRAPN
jgi:hypothetical protein